MRARARQRIGVSFAASVAALALAAATLLACQCQRDPFQRQRVIFILLDALRADRLSIYGYPRETTPQLDALARHGVLFRDHFVHSTSTRDSLPEMLYSRYLIPPLFPASPNVPLSSPEELFQGFDEESISLPRALSRHGLYTAAISAHTWLREGTAFAREFDEFHDLTSTTPYPEEFGKPRAEAVTDAAIRWIRAHRDEGFFLYLHYMDTHFPHLRIEETERFLDPDVDTPEVRGRFGPRGRPRPPRVLLPKEKRYLDALYDGSVAYVDHHLGRLFAYLERAGFLDDTLIVVTSDHGEHLLEVPERFAHGGPWYDAVAHVPLILSHPARLEPGIVEGLTAAVDLMPTILDLVGHTLPAGKTADGRSLLPLATGKTRTGAREEIVLSRYGLRTPTRKLVFDDLAHASIQDWFRRKGPALSPVDLALEFYDLSADPLETENLVSSRPEEADRLLQVYLERMQAPYRRQQKSQRTEPPDSAFAIRASDFTVEEVALASSKPPDGWHKKPHWMHYRLLADAGAPPVQVSAPVPSGDYTLSIAVRGAIRLTLPDGSTVTVKGAPVPETRRLNRVSRGDVVELGAVTVRENRFRVELAPVDLETAALIFYFGFTPAHEEEARQPFEERLRALGYIN